MGLDLNSKITVVFGNALVPQRLWAYREMAMYQAAKDNLVASNVRNSKEALEFYINYKKSIQTSK